VFDLRGIGLFVDRHNMRV